MSLKVETLQIFQFYITPLLMGIYFFYLNYSGDFFPSRLRYEICQQNYNYVSLKIPTEVFPFLVNLQGLHPSSLAGRLDEWRANRRTQSSRMKNYFFFQIYNQPSCLFNIVGFPSDTLQNYSLCQEIPFKTQA